MKVKKKKPIFVFQAAGETLKVIKALFGDHSLELAAVEQEVISKNDDEDLSQKLSRALKKLGYGNNLLILSLPRNFATLRFIKIPSVNPEEIERIVCLQASTFLPYPSAELITGYETAFVDKEGYSHINLIIVHKDVIQRYINLLEGLNIRNFSIVLSSYGICNLYTYLQPEAVGLVMVVDIDSAQAELDIIENKKLVFSRYFNLDLSQSNWKDLLTNEINKTKDAFLKEVSKENLAKVVVISSGKRLPENWQTASPFIVEELKYLEKIKYPEEIASRISNSEYSFASLVGFALKDVPESLSLLPNDLKAKIKANSNRKEKLRLALLSSGIIALLAIGLLKNLDNKSKYLARLKTEMAKIAQEARPLDEIDKRFEFMQKRQQKKPSTLDVFSEIQRIIPASVSLVNFSYEEDVQLILRGQSPALNSIVSFVSELEKSVVFKNFDVKIRYATQKKASAGEIVDFEIDCVKR